MYINNIMEERKKTSVTHVFICFNRSYVAIAHMRGHWKCDGAQKSVELANSFRFECILERIVISDAFLMEVTLKSANCFVCSFFFHLLIEASAHI